MRPGDDEQDAPCSEQDGHPGGQRARRDLETVTPVAGTALDARRRQPHLACRRVRAGGRFVEAEMAVRAQPEDREVDTSCGGDRLVVSHANLGEVRGVSVQAHDSLACDARRLEQVPLEPAVQRPRIVVAHADVLVELEDPGVVEVDLAPPHACCELTVETDGRTAGCADERCARLGTEDLRDDVGAGCRQLVGVGGDPPVEAQPASTPPSATKMPPVA